MILQLLQHVFLLVYGARARTGNGAAARRGANVLPDA